MIDSLLVGIGNWRTTLTGLLLGIVIYEAGIGNKMPSTTQEWWAFALGVLAVVLGVASKDARTGSLPRMIVLALALGFALAGCAGPFGLAGSPDQIHELAKVKDANVTCIIANTPYGKGSALFLNLDKGVVTGGQVTIDDACKTTITIEGTK